MNTNIKKVVAVLALIALVVVTAFALGRTPTPPASVTLAWNASPGTNVITNYNVYYGLATQTYTGVTAAGTNLTVTVTNLSRGTTYYFAATAVDNNGLESMYSTEVSTTTHSAPSAPTGFGVTGSN